MTSINSEKIYYHNLTLIVSKSLTYTGIGSNTKTHNLTNNHTNILSLSRLSNEELIESNSPGLFNSDSSK